MRIVLLIGISLLTLAPLLAQVIDSSDVLDNDNETQFLIENLVEDADLQEFDFDTEFERLEQYRKNPLDINKSGKEILVAFGLLSEIQIQALLNYRKNFGQIYSFFELLNVPAFDEQTVRRIIPYLTFEPVKELENFSFKRALKYGKNQFFIRYQRTLEKSEGFFADDSLTAREYPGSPDKLYLRYRLTYKDRLSMGLTLEKDAGEQYFVPFSQNANIKLPDYMSFHFYIKDLNRNVKALAIGDYQIYFGQGLTMWAGFGIRKGANPLNVKRLAPAIRPYTSVNEALFLRGAAATFAFGRMQQLETTVFASHRFRDANIALADTSDDASLDVLQISSLQESGLHRTEAEIADKNSTQMISSGAEVKYRSDSWQIGAHVVYNRLSDSLNRVPQLYQKYQFTGQDNLMFGMDYTWLYKNMQVFGETALSHNGGLATMNGLLASLDERLGISIIQRHYDKKYQSLTGNAFGESSGLNNESGVYLGLNSNLGKGFTFNGYFDVFRFPWLRSLVDAPSGGYEYLLRLDYAPGSKWAFYAQYRLEDKQSNLSDNITVIDNLIYKRRQNLRLHLRYRINREFELRSRIEFSAYKDHEVNKGFMLYQDLVWNPAFIPLKVQLRFAIFDAQDYDTRIYAYENDVLYAFSVPAYYGRGTRFYINMSYRINRSISLWLRFAQTYFSDRDIISAGNDQINSNRRSEIKVQLRAQF
jgi:hypothetical protein